MKLFKQKTWQFETSGVEGEVKLFGVNTERSFCLYKVVINGDTHSFVAGEFSNMIWGFYLLKY